MLGWSQKKTRRIRNLAGIKAKRHKKHSCAKIPPELSAPDNLLRPYYQLKDPKHLEKGYTFKALTDPALRIWAQDFTYLWWNGRFYYMACIKELATRRIVGWCLSRHHDAEMVCTALTDALDKCPAPAILHDDRGSEYLSLKHSELCAKHNIAMSVSAAGKPPENGFMESFFSSFKHEALDIVKQCPDETKLYEHIAGWIHYYNHIRIHTALKMAPESYARILHATNKQQDQPELFCPLRRQNSSA